MRRPGRIALLLVLMVAAACGGSSTPSRTTAEMKHAAADYVAVIKLAKVNFAVIRQDRNGCLKYRGSVCRAFVQQLSYDRRYTAAVSTTIYALDAVGPPAPEIESTLTMTLLRLRRIQSLGTAWTECAYQAGSLNFCASDRTAFTSAQPDLDRVFALWNRYL